MSSVDKIISDIIKDTPVGELPKVIEDLKLIIDKNINHELSIAIKEYNLTNFTSIDVENNPIIISKYNQDDDEFFIDSKNGVKFKVDHLLLKPQEVTKIEQSNSKYDSELSKYVIDQYNQGEYLINNDVILIKGHKTSSLNYWTGSWRSKYDLQTGKGEINIDVHYYEDGNVRLQTLQNVEIDISSPISSIKQVETKIQLSLNKQFANLNEAVFKQLRRQLPVTRSKINWGKAIGNYKLGKLTSSSSSSS